MGVEAAPSASTARLALFTVFLAHDTGRAERWTAVPAAPDLPAVADDDCLESAILAREPDRAVAIALSGRESTATALARASLADRATAPIVLAHVVKLAHAANMEAAVIGSPIPQAAAARYAAAPRLERFVASNVAEAINFVETGAPPKR